jgi:nickel-dependent lactate racemase
MSGNVTLPYDKAVLELPLPPSARVTTLVPRKMRAIDDPETALIDALESPVGIPPLSALVSGMSGRLLIVVNDHTRVSGKERALPWLLDCLNGCGVPDDRIILLVALGTHVAPSDRVLRESIGPASERVNVVLHDMSGPMARCGVTSRGTPVEVNPLLREAGFVILYTSAVYHYFAGYGGGRKAIIPGIASLNTIRTNHSLVFENPKGAGGRHLNVASGILDGNPVHEDMLEGARMAIGDRPYMSIVTVMTPERGFGCFVAGELDASHRQACDFVDAYNIVEIDEPADVVLASAGGHPSDLNVVQAHKGMDNAVRALKPGGAMLYAMACAGGYGHPAIEEFAPLDLDSIRARLAENYVINGQTVYALKEKAAEFRIVCLSELDSGFFGDLGMTRAADLDHALALIAADISGPGLVYHIPRSDITFPRPTQAV